MKTTYLFGGAAAVLVAGFVAFAFLSSDGPMGGMDHSNVGTGTAETAAGEKPPSTKAFEDAMADMMKGMMAAPTGIPDVDFAKGMIPHHEGAIAMAKVAKEYAKDPDLLKLADGIIGAQEGEIATFKGWLGKADQNAMEKVPDSIKTGEAAMAAIMKDMSMAYTGNADVDFVKGMIPHHRGAIDMAKVVLQYGKDAEIKKLAEGIIAAQETEIAFMKDWLAKKGS